MKTIFRSVVAAAGLLAVVSTAAFAESGTTRIVHDEPYGAIVTKEAGVLVFRGLPPTRKVIVNPDGKTPLDLRMTAARATKVVVSSQDDYIRGRGPKVLRLK